MTAELPQCTLESCFILSQLCFIYLTSWQKYNCSLDNELCCVWWHLWPSSTQSEGHTGLYRHIPFVKEFCCVYERWRWDARLSPPKEGERHSAVISGLGLSMHSFQFQWWEERTFISKRQVSCVLSELCCWWVMHRLLLCCLWCILFMSIGLNGWISYYF